MAVWIKRGSRILRVEWRKMLHLVSFEVCVLLVQRVLDKLIILSYFLLHLWIMRIVFIDSSIIFCYSV